MHVEGNQFCILLDRKCKSMSAECMSRIVIQPIELDAYNYGFLFRKASVTLHPSSRKTHNTIKRSWLLISFCCLRWRCTYFIKFVQRHRKRPNEINKLLTVNGLPISIWVSNFISGFAVMHISYRSMTSFNERMSIISFPE